MVLHVDGGLVVSGRDVAHVKEGQTRTVLALDGVTGFNDLTAGPDGAVYVGALRFRPFGGESPVPGDVWRVGEGGEAEMLFAGIPWPNGIGFSPDGESLYVSDYASGQVLVRRSSGPPEVFAETPSGDADGLAVDAEGGVWVALGSGGGIGRYSPRGRLEEVLDIPADFVSSLCFGGEDMQDLYVTTAGGLFRGRADVPGLPLTRASV
jgi:gluconolactonase